MNQGVCEDLRVANPKSTFSVYSNFCHYILLRLYILLALWTVGPALCMRSCFDWVLR